MEKLPLVRIAEVAFLSQNVERCLRFYNGLGFGFRVSNDRKILEFVSIGEQLFGFASPERGFFTGFDSEMANSPLHIAFEVEKNSLNQCIEFLTSRGVKCSPVVEMPAGWHGVEKSQSIYFRDPDGNIMELWEPLI
jgi:catechol 2,3-dioxygenase-like lactoylglutathione lyase family enzyme